MKSIVMFEVIALALAVAIGQPAGAHAGWDGQQVDRDGVPYMMNTVNPIDEPVTMAPDRLWRVGGDDEEEYLFGVLTQIASDAKGNVYLLDGQLNEVYVFSSDGEYIRSIGREGEGPGEFQRPADLFMTPNGNVAVMQRMPGKIVVLTPEGEPAGDISVPKPEGGGRQMFSAGRLAGDHLVMMANTFARKETGFEMRASLIGIGENGEELATYHERSNARDFANMVIDEKTLGTNALVWSTDQQGRVYTSDDFDAYDIKVWNADGTLARVIERDYAHRERSKEEIEENTPRLMIRRGNQTMEPETKMSKTDRDIQQIYPRDDGTLWVLTSRGGFDAGEGAIATFDVFDPDGRFATQVSLTGQGNWGDDGFHIVGGRLYVVTGLRSAQRAMFGGQVGGDEDEEEPEPMAVIAYDLGPVVQSMK